MTAQNTSTSHASATQPATKSPNRTRKPPRNAAAQAPASVIAPTGQAVAPVAPQNVQNAPRPLPTYLQAVSPYPTSVEVTKLIVEHGLNLADLGTPCAHATGLLSALLELLTHKAAFEATGTRWSVLHMFCAWSSDFERLYKVALQKLDEKRVQVLREAAFERAVVGAERGVWFNGVKVGVENVPSDKMHELLLRGLDPETFGKASEDNQSQAVQVNITL